MKKLIILLMVLMLAMGAAFAEGQMMVVINCNEWVSLRSAPSTDAARLAEVPLGAQVTNCMPGGGDFIRCDFNGMTGYILSAYLGAVGESVGGGLGEMTVVNCSEWVSLRSAPDTEAARLVEVPLGAAVVNCSLDSNGFVRCEYNGMTGYILGKYLAADFSEAVSGTDVAVPEENGTASNAAEESYGAYYESMVVVNCEEWVSLRNAPSTSSPRIIQVPLGATVTECLEVRDGFVYCRYADLSGYIQAKYLSADVGAATTAQNPTGNQIVNHTFDGLTVTAYVEFVDNGEVLKVYCHDASGSKVWDFVTATGEMTELSKMHAFIGGTSDAPVVMAYNSDIGLTAMDYRTGSALWTLYSAEIDLGGSISAATASDGTMYIGGFYGPNPAAISAQGEILWQSNLDDDIYWLNGIRVTEEGIIAGYDCVYEHEREGEVCFGFDGSVIWIH